jgi:hypothetical protein
MQDAVNFFFHARVLSPVAETRAMRSTNNLKQHAAEQMGPSEGRQLTLTALFACSASASCGKLKKNRVCQREATHVPNEGRIYALFAGSYIAAANTDN